MACSECGANNDTSPVADLCRPCLDRLAAAEPVKPIDADTLVHLNFGGGKGRWTTIGDLLADTEGGDDEQ